ncbi:MAG: hypothetical protein IPJ45_09040 [Ignavibacteria bacterium]|nr:hypothetical protein [Ignavibacteria bacterium]
MELQVNIPTTIKLLQTEPATGENSYGKWWLFNVECEGTEYSYFPPEKVVKILKENNVVQDEEVVITKKLIKSGKKNITDYEVHVLETTHSEPVVTNGRSNGYEKVMETKQNGQLSVSTANGESNGHKNSNGYKNGNGHTNGNGNAQTVIAAPVLSKDYPVMLQCMTEAMMLRDELGHDVDVNKLGITLFLRKVKP